MLYAFARFCNLQSYQNVSSPLFINRTGSLLYDDFQSMGAVLRWIAHDGNVVFENLRLEDPDFKPSRFTDVDFDSWNGVVEMEGHKYDNYIVGKLHDNFIVNSYLEDWLKRRITVKGRLVFCHACHLYVHILPAVNAEFLASYEKQGAWHCEYLPSC